MKYKNLKLQTPFDIRIIREDENDLDLFIDINYQSIDILIEKNELNLSRIQLLMVRGIILRITKLNYTCTVHFLRDIDLFSAFANFEFDYKDKILNIMPENNKVIFKLECD